MKTTKTIAKIAGAVLAGMMALSFASCNEKNGGSGAVGADGLTKAQAKILKEKPAPEADFEIELSDDGSYVTVTEYKGKAKTLVIPSTIQGLPVKRVGVYSLFDSSSTMKSLTSVVISEGVVGIGGFKDCPALTTVVLPSTLKGIEESAFAGCEKLTTVNLPEGLVYIGGYAFNGTALASVTFPKSLKAMGYYAFLSCGNLAEINIPDGLSLAYVETKDIDFIGNDYVASDESHGGYGRANDFSFIFSGKKINESVALQQLLKNHKTVAIDYKTWKDKYVGKPSSTWDW